jgi:hypothetical protein
MAHLRCGVCRAEARVPEYDDWVESFNEFLASHLHPEDR